MLNYDNGKKTKANYDLLEHKSFSAPTKIKLTQYKINLDNHKKISTSVFLLILTFHGPFGNRKKIFFQHDPRGHLYIGTISTTKNIQYEHKI